ncbi:phage tail tape measure protein [Mucilaginibacter paludis]|uniref:Uncharacterized protein n=1 Tax=Mucilaginibacter paludis DSM 18603 TaxID=714943 RepID=H1YAZ3_9SPHI|nr:hypothetical protein [Mucilaginibacter paludis]EHQ30026.1 hypothetical protein Mucpa_5966 [Mucilaginibacter paludis DSM 18603]
MAKGLTRASKGTQNTIDQSKSYATSLNDVRAAVDGVGKGAATIAGGLDIPLDSEKMVEFAKQGIEMAEKMEQANAQVKAALINSNNAAGLSYNELEKDAKKFSDTLPFAQDQIVDMQSTLLSYPAVTKATFNTASQAIMDIATRQHAGLADTAKLVGAALQSPVEGLKSLHSMNVDLTASQTATITKLVETGHTAQAQSIILKELQTRFGGAAQAAADADPLYAYHSIMDSIKLTVGEVAGSLLKTLIPALKTVGGVVSGVTDFFKDNVVLVKAIGAAVGIVAIGMGTYSAVLKGVEIWESLVAFKTGLVNGALLLQEAYSVAASTGLGTMEAAWWAVNAAMEANPIGLIIAGIVMVGLVVYTVIHKFDLFKAVLMGIWEVIKDVTKVAWGLNEAFIGFQTGNLSLMADGIANVKAGTSDIGDAFSRGYNKSLAASKKNEAEEKKKADDAKKGQETLATALTKHKAPENVAGVSTAAKGVETAKTTTTVAPTTTGSKPQSTIGKVVTAPTGKPTPTPPAKPAPSATSKVSGEAKATTINIHIGALIKSFSISTTNMEESTSKVQEMVTRVLLSAVNDSQLVVGQ